MRKTVFFYALTVSAGLFCLASCAKTESSVERDMPVGWAIAFSVDGDIPDYGLSTKASVVNTASLNTGGFNVTAVPGGSGAPAWTNVHFEKSGTCFVSDKVWPASNPGYHFYASNGTLSYVGEGACYLTVTNATDVVYALNTSPTFMATNALVFNHVFARIGDVTVTGEEGYTVSNVHLTVVPKTGGRFNMLSGHGYTDGTGWDNLTTGSAVELANTTGVTKSNDVWLVPGLYDFTFSWTATKGSYSESFTTTYRNGLLTAGRVNNITAGLRGEADDIAFNVSVTDWVVAGTNDMGTLEGERYYSFGGFEIAPGPMYYNGSTVEIKDNWNYDSYGSVYSLNAGSTYFTFEDLKSIFGTVTEYGQPGYDQVVNINDPLDGWRLPTQSELSSIYGTSRAGSSVNGSVGKHYALIQLSGVTHCGSSTPNGVLLFPDGETIIGKTLSGMDNSTQTTGVTLSELNAYLEQGCAFLPCSGWCSNSAGGQFGSGGVYTFYMSSEKNTGNNAYSVWISGSSFNPNDQEPSYCWTMVRLVKPIE